MIRKIIIWCICLAIGFLLFMGSPIIISTPAAWYKSTQVPSFKEKTREDVMAWILRENNLDGFENYQGVRYKTVLVNNRFFHLKDENDFINNKVVINASTWVIKIRNDSSMTSAVYCRICFEFDENNKVIKQTKSLEISFS